MDHLKFVDRTNKAVQYLEENDQSNTIAMETLQDGQSIRDKLLIPAISTLSTECLDKQLGKNTVRDLLLTVAMQSETDQLIDAVVKKLDIK